MLRKFKQDYPRFRGMFQFEQFNAVQNECYPKIFNHQENVIVSAPTSSGKTVLFELMIAKLMDQQKTKCLYLAPIKSLCHEKYQSWRKKFMSTMSVLELTGDTLEMEPGEFGNADIFVATPEKIDYISRKNLNFLKELNLLLIDEIHMLNMEDRGAILEAIVSRIMSINRKIRIMAVSATIPNIKEVAQWLKVPPHLICVFGEEYRPAKLHKVVLGFKPANNDFNFEKMLNFKILDVIRQYSFGGGTLIFCQTQKGTEEACSKLVTSASMKEFVPNQKLGMELINSSKMVDNFTLKSLIPHGVAFHNASLSMKDRSIVEGLFLDFKVKVLCTTSTLAMGINLPARLVIIKSTKCYKGSGKGYQEYTQIELDQMMGRAGRIPFDKEGTVVIMTEKANYNKYTGENKLQNLQSQLYNQFIDHLNTEISLKSIQSFSEAIDYFKNSFCYIRMQNSPKLYNLSNRNDVEKFVSETCMASIKKLAQYEIIQYLEANQRIFPRQCSTNISKNAIEVETIIKVIEQMGEIRTERDYIMLLSNASQLSKYRSKLDQRKSLKDLNEKNRYTLKEAISTFDKKCFVLIQAELTGIHIDNWELRKQASEMIFFFKRLAFCVKSLAFQRKSAAKTFWLYLFGCMFHKYFLQGFWQSNEEKVLKQIKKVASKWKNITARGIRTLTDLTYGLSKLDIFGNGISSATIKASIEDEINLLNNSLQISAKKIQTNSSDIEMDLPVINSLKESNHMLKFIFTKNFSQNLKSINIIIQHNDSIYHSGWLNSNSLQFSAYLKNTQTQKYFVAVIKQGYIGFDEFYWFQRGVLKKTDLKKQENEKKLIKTESLNFLSLNHSFDNFEDQEFQESSEKKKRGHSLESSIKRVTKNKNKSALKQPKLQIPKEIKFMNKKRNPELNQINEEKVLNNFFPEDSFQSQPSKQKILENSPSSIMSSTLKANKKSKQLKLTQNFSTIKRKYVFDEETEQRLKQENPLGKSLKRTSGYRDLKSYNWKPGFEEIKDEEINENVAIYNQEKHMFDKEGHAINSGQKERKLMLSDEDDSQSQNHSTKKIGDNNQSKNVINELNNFMKQKNNKIAPQKTSKISDFNSSNSVPPGFGNKKKKPSMIKFVPQKQSSIFNENCDIEETNTSSVPFWQKLQKIPDPNLIPKTQVVSKVQNGRNVPFLNRQTFYQKEESQKVSLKNQIFESNILQGQKLKPKEQPQKKKYKSPYEYFESFLTDQDDF